MDTLVQPLSVGAVDISLPPCGTAHCELATGSHIPISGRACDACRANAPYPVVAMACSNRNGLPFCISFSDSLTNNQLAEITDRQRLQVFRWSAQQQRYARDLL